MRKLMLCLTCIFMTISIGPVQAETRDRAALRAQLLCRLTGCAQGQTQMTYSRSKWRTQKSRRRYRRSTKRISKYIAQYLAKSLHQNGFTQDETAALMTVAFFESRFEPRVRSARDMPDEKVGGSYGLFQFSKQTLETLGFKVRELQYTPGRKVVIGPKLNRILDNNVRAISKFVRAGRRCNGGVPWIQRVRNSCQGNAQCFAKNTFAAWQAGVCTSPADVARAVRRNPGSLHRSGSLAYVHTSSIQRLRQYPYFQRATRSFLARR